MSHANPFVPPIAKPGIAAKADCPALKFALFPLLFSAVAGADVAFDASLGRPNVPAGTLSGTQIDIRADYGRQVGANLFHSFARFSIDAGQTVTFNASGATNPIDNVIARVTGDQASRIDGVLRSSIPGADFYLLNPNGLIFGPDAELDVQGAFHASTADFLRMVDGTVYAAQPDKSAVLSSAAPAAFGFLDAPAAIQVQGACLDADCLATSALRVNDGESLSLTGGDISLQDVDLIAQGGNIRLLSLKTAGEFAVDGSDRIEPASQGGRIQMSNSTLAALSNESQSGGIEVQTGALTLSGSAIATSTHTAQPGGEIDILADRIVLTGSRIQNRVRESATGDGGNISIESRVLRLNDRSLITAEALKANSSQGRAGNIAINGITSLSLSGHSVITALSGRMQPSGDITIRGQGADARIRLREGSAISSYNSWGIGCNDCLNDAGTIDIGNIDSLRIESGSSINVDALRGNAGDIDIQARTLLYLSSSAITTSAGESLDEQGYNGGGGNIHIDPVFTVLDNSKIIANAQLGAGGEITIFTQHYLTSVDSQVTASSASGDPSLQGTVTISVPYSNIAQSLGLLPSGYLDVTNRLYDDCSATGRNSSFIWRGRGSLPLSPEGVGDYAGLCGY